MAGLSPFGGGVIARRITKVGEHSNPVFRSFIIFLRRGSYKEAAKIRSLCSFLAAVITGQNDHSLTPGHIRLTGANPYQRPMDQEDADEDADFARSLRRVNMM